jgi:hypothetical protein
VHIGPTGTAWEKKLLRPRVWELLGAREQGLLRTLFSVRSMHEGRKENRVGGDPE